MNDFDKALAAAREATTRYAAESARVHGPQHLNHYADRMAEANIDLFDALDAARGQAVAFRAPGAQSWFPITEQKRLDELIATGHVFEFAYAAPPAAAVPEGYGPIPPEYPIPSPLDYTRDAQRYMTAKAHAEGWNKCRAAMLAAANKENSRD